MSRYLDVQQLGCDTNYGVARTWIGEDGDAVAFTSDVRRGLAAINAMARGDLGAAASTDRVTTGWARFEVDPADADEWKGEFCAAGATGATAVVVAHEVGEVTL